MNIAPERYQEDQVLTTYLETQNITIYSHGPIGTKPFELLFQNVGTRTTLAYIKAHHWKNITKDYDNHTHILMLRNPIEQHIHGTFLHAMSMNQVSRKRDNMFYSTHLRPYLATIEKAEFDFYIPFEKLDKYVFDWKNPLPPPMETGRFFDLNEELAAYDNIRDNKMELEVPQWRELLMRGQLEEI
jgi:hypothetical protein